MKPERIDHVALYVPEPEEIAARLLAERPLLNHLGLLVESVEQIDLDHLDVVGTVDAENSRAVFVSGPDGIEVEYIEHKPSFALAAS